MLSEQQGGTMMADVSISDPSLLVPRVQSPEVLLLLIKQGVNQGQMHAFRRLQLLLIWLKSIREWQCWSESWLTVNTHISSGHHI